MEHKWNTHGTEMEHKPLSIQDRLSHLSSHELAPEDPAHAQIVGHVFAKPKILAAW